MNAVSRILPLFILPIGVTLILLVAGLVLRRRSMMIAAAALLWITSMPIVGGKLARAAEGGAIRIPTAEAPTGDAIVVLSMGRAIAPGPAAISEWQDADRFFAGVELLQAGKAPLLVFTGGAHPSPKASLEGDLLVAYARQFGVPEDRVTTTGRVVNTAEEAAAVAALLRARQTTAPRIVLVTSAFHMSRATAAFTGAGMTVSGFPVDFTGAGSARWSLGDIVPSADALLRSQDVIRELYGRGYYQLRSLW